MPLWGSHENPSSLSLGMLTECDFGNIAFFGGVLEYVIQLLGVKSSNEG